MGWTILAFTVAIVGLPAAIALGIPAGDHHPLHLDTQDVKKKIEQTANEADIPVSDGKAPGEGVGDEGGDEASDAGLLNNLLDDWAASGAFAFGALSLTFFGYVLASHYVHPKEALENPQRAMLYGFVRGNPGVHLKQLSKEFDMKTSTVLWHIRKLERADLVRSSKANGFRVFYPVEGGVEAKKVSMALTALSNENARTIFEFIASHPGALAKRISKGLELNPGTVRWHLKKLRDMGLVAEVPEERNPAYYASELGAKAYEQATGLAMGPVPASRSGVPTAETLAEAQAAPERTPAAAAQ